MEKNEYIEVQAKDGVLQIPMTLLKKFLIVKRMLVELYGNPSDAFVTENDLLGFKNDDEIFDDQALEGSIPLPEIATNMLNLILKWFESPDEFYKNIFWEQLFKLIPAALYLDCVEILKYLVNVVIRPLLIRSDCEVRSILSTEYKPVTYDDERNSNIISCIS